MGPEWTLINAQFSYLAKFCSCLTHIVPCNIWLAKLLAVRFSNIENSALLTHILIKNDESIKYPEK